MEDEDGGIAVVAADLFEVVLLLGLGLLFVLLLELDVALSVAIVTGLPSLLPFPPAVLFDGLVTRFIASHTSGFLFSYPGHVMPAAAQFPQAGEEPSHVHTRRRHSQHWGEFCVPAVEAIKKKKKRVSLQL